jgi:hypothetical protein
VKAQPRWAWFVVWRNLASVHTEPKVIKATYASEETLNWEELPWVKTKKPTIHFPVLR